MLPRPDLSFTIPSIHDNANLECRIYHPKRSRPKLRDTFQKCGVIFAHPYAPMGGCFDDPVVAAVGSEILEAGSVLGTFNFRFEYFHSLASCPTPSNLKQWSRSLPRLDELDCSRGIV